MQAIPVMNLGMRSKYRSAELTAMAIPILTSVPFLLEATKGRKFVNTVPSSSP